MHARGLCRLGILCSLYSDTEFAFTLMSGSITNKDHRIGWLARKTFALAREAFSGAA